jgi:membrane protein
MLFAIVPAFTSLTLLLNLLNVDESILYKYIYEFLPTESSNDLVEFLSYSPSVGAGISIIVTFIVSLFVISRGIVVFIDISSSLYKYKNNMNIIRKGLYSFFVSLGLVISLFVIVLLDVVLSSVLSDYDRVFSFLKYLLIFVVMSFILLILYMIGLDKNMKKKHTVLGSLCASFGITLLLFLFNIYTVYLVDYSSTYGPLSWLIVLLVLFRFISMIIYMGLIINVINYKEKRLVNTSR